MCGRYTLICIDDLGTRFRLFDPTIGFRSHFNIAPGQSVPVIIQRDHIEAALMRWGLRFGDPEGRPVSPAIINVRSEKLAERRSFRRLLAGRRCLVPATGFFEWTKQGSQKSPFYFWLKGERLFAFAALYDNWTDPAGNVQSAYAIITTAANDVVEPVHDRMPVILRREDESRWLSGEVPTDQEMREVLSFYPSEDMEAYPVSNKVNSADIDDDSLIRPLATLT